MPSTFFEIQADTALIGNSGGQHCIGRTTDGRMFCVARVSGTTPDTRLFLSTDNGETWTVDGELNSTFGGGDRQLIVDPSDKITISNHLKNGANGAYYLHRTGAGTFSSLFQATSVVQHEHSYFARDTLGRGHLVVKPQAAGEIRYWRQASSSEDNTGTAWTGIVNELVTNVGVSAGSKAVLIIDKNDLAHVIYRDTSANRYKYTNRSGGVWAAPSEIMASPIVHIGDYTSPVLAVNRLDIHFVFYAGAVGTSVTPYYARRDSGGVWTTEQVDATYISSSGHINPSHGTCQDLQGRIYAYCVRDQDTAYFSRTGVAIWQQEVFDFGGSNSTANFASACQPYPLLAGQPIYPSIGGHFGGRFNNGIAQASRFTYFAGAGLTFTTPEDYPRCDQEPTRASIVFAGEGASEATLSITPDFVFSGEERFLTHSTRTERGYVVTHPKYPTSRRLFQCAFTHHSLADRSTLVAFLLARGGGRGAFTLVLPDGTGSVKVHIVEGSFQFSKINPGVYNTEFTAEELLN